MVLQLNNSASNHERFWKSIKNLRNLNVISFEQKKKVSRKEIPL